MEDLEKLAKQRASEKIDFFTHLVVFVLVNALLLVVNLVTSPNSLWVVWVLLGWGIGLVVHGANVFIVEGMFDGFKDRLVESELKKLKSKNNKS
jgi:hypothetical protein